MLQYENFDPLRIALMKTKNSIEILALADPSPPCWYLGRNISDEINWFYAKIAKAYQVSNFLEVQWMFLLEKCINTARCHCFNSTFLALKIISWAPLLLCLIDSAKKIKNKKWKIKKIILSLFCYILIVKSLYIETTHWIFITYTETKVLKIG